MKWMSLAILTLALSIQAAEAPMDAVADEIVASRNQGSPLNFALDLKYVPLRFPNVTANSGHGMQIALEWLPIGKYKGYAGKPVIGASAGYGRIRDLGTAVGGRISLNAIPVSGYLGYRADFLDNQILVPFGKISRSILFESRNPGGSSRYESWDYSAGLELCLNPIDPHSARQLDSSIGINNTYLVVEWIKSVPIEGKKQSSNLSREEWQVGLRFEM